VAIQWTPDLAVGVKTIDEQHQELFVRVNQLLEATSRGVGRTEVTNVVRFLAEYVVLHFREEEQAMADHGYPELEPHRAEHRGFVQDFARLIIEYREHGATTTVLAGLNRQLAEWLLNHVARSDKAFGTYLVAADRATVAVGSASKASPGAS
jgi:hemerythrin